MTPSHASFLLTSAALILVGACTTKTVDAGELEARLARELPVGTPYAHALAVLPSRKIPHSAYDPKLHIIKGSLRNTETGFLYTRDILIRIDFDSTGRLLSRRAEVVTEGP